MLFDDTHHCHSERSVRQVLFRQKYVYKLAQHFAPLERDPELRRYWIEQVMGGDAIFTSDQIFFVDESSKKLKDCRRPRVFAVKGDKVQIPVVKQNRMSFFTEKIKNLNVCVTYLSDNDCDKYISYVSILVLYNPQLAYVKCTT